MRMPSTTDPQTAPSPQELKYERAVRAVKNFNRIKPQLEAFARVFTGNKKMIVLPTHGASATDGSKIFMRVNIELGDEYKHDTYTCDKRDALDQLLCPACMARENMMVPLFHEIGHIVYDSFQAMSEADKRHAIEATVAEAEKHGIVGKRLDKIREFMTKRPPATYVEAASRVSPYLHPILNALEDARVNALTMKARPGMKVMFSARATRIFEEGNEQMDGSVVLWREQPENAQVIIGLFALASDYPYEGWFAPDVEEALADDRIRTLVAESVESDDAGTIYALGFPILERLRELGYCRVPDEPQNEEEEEEAAQGHQSQPDNEDTGGDNDEQGDSDDEQGDGAENEGEGAQEDADEAGMSAEQEGSDKASSGNAGEQGDESGNDDQQEDGSSDDEQDGDSSSEGDDDPLEGSHDDDEDEDSAAGDAGSEDEEESEHDEGDGAGSGSDREDDDDESDDDGDSSGRGEDESLDDDSEADDDGEGEGSGDGGDESDTDPLGSPDEVMQALATFGEHDDSDGEDGDDDGEGGDSDDPSDYGGPTDDDEIKIALHRAIAQERDFDSQAENVLEVVRYDDGLGPAVRPRIVKIQSKYQHDPVDEATLQRSLGKMRVAFSENKKGARERSLKRGRVDAAMLARRVPFDDPRVFQQRRRPGKRDYHVIVGVDVSGSTDYYGRLKVIKSAVMAQAELLSRVGVTFEVWAHTCDFSGVHNPEYDRGNAQWNEYFNLLMHQIKAPNKPWDSETKRKVEGLVPYQANLDGHTLEFYRKRLDSSQATDKLIMYYTDGDMPFANYAEELRVLKREILTCKQRNYEIVGIGVGNDDPSKHGLDTVRIDSVSDVHLVVEELHKRLT